MARFLIQNLSSLRAELVETPLDLDAINGLLDELNRQALEIATPAQMGGAPIIDGVPQNGPTTIFIGEHSDPNSPFGVDG